MAGRMSIKQLMRVRMPQGTKEDKVRDVVFSPDQGNTGFVGVMYETRSSAIFRTSTLEQLAIELNVPASGMAFRPVDATAINSARSPEVAIAYGDRHPWIDLFDLGTCEPIERLRFARVHSVVFNQQGTMLAGGTTSGTVVVWTLSDKGVRKELFNVNISRSRIVRLAFNGHGNTLFALTARGETFVLDAASGKPQRYQIVGSPQDAEGFDCWAHDCHRHQAVVAFAGSCADREARCLVTVVEMDRGKHFSFATDHLRYVRRLKFYGDKALLVLGDGGAELWNLNPCRRVRLTVNGEKLERELNSLLAADTIILAGQ